MKINLNIWKYDISFNQFNDSIGEKIMQGLSANQTIIKFNVEYCQVKTLIINNIAMYNKIFIDK